MYFRSKIINFQLWYVDNLSVCVYMNYLVWLIQQEDKYKIFILVLKTINLAYFCIDQN